MRKKIFEKSGKYPKKTGIRERDQKTGFSRPKVGIWSAYILLLCLFVCLMFIHFNCNQLCLEYP